jgi:hypothetical protein
LKMNPQYLSLLLRAFSAGIFYFVTLLCGLNKQAITLIWIKSGRFKKTLDNIKCLCQTSLHNRPVGLMEDAMTKDLIDDMLKRPVRRSMDGLNEMLFGIVFLLWGVILITLELWGKGWPAWTSWSWLIVLLVAFYLQALARRLRARWVHPRIGYVKVHSPILGKRVIAMILGGVAALVFVTALVQSSHFRLSLPADLGLIFAASSFVLWVRLRVRRFLVYALLTLASGLFAQWMLPASVASEAFICMVSVIYLVGGVFALRHLMRQPLAAEDQP